MAWFDAVAIVLFLPKSMDSPRLEYRFFGQFCLFLDRRRLDEPEPRIFLYRKDPGSSFGSQVKGHARSKPFVFLAKLTQSEDLQCAHELQAALGIQDQDPRNLDQVARRARFALRDDGRAQQYIVTHSGKGYGLRPEIKLDIKRDAEGIRAWLDRGFAPQNERPAAEREWQKLTRTGADDATLAGGGEGPLSQSPRDPEVVDTQQHDDTNNKRSPGSAERAGNSPDGQCRAVLDSLPRPNNMVRLGSRGDRFIGRVSELWDVHHALASTHLAIVTGLSGVGKTQLAIEYIWRFANGYPGGVFWIEADRGRLKMVETICRAADIQ